MNVNIAFLDFDRIVEVVFTTTSMSFERSLHSESVFRLFLADLRFLRQVVAKKDEDSARRLASMLQHTRHSGRSGLPMKRFHQQLQLKQQWH